MQFKTLPISSPHPFRPTDLYFSCDNGRLTGIISPNPIGQEGEPVHIYVADWQEVEDIHLPDVVLITDKSGDFRFDFTQITLNTVDEAIFNIPASIQSPA